MLSRPTRALLVTALAIAGACGGNGGDGKSEQGAATTVTGRGPTKQEYIRQGDAICADVDRKVDAVPTPRPDAPPAEALRFSEQLRNATQPGFQQFKALPTPPADRATADQLNSYLDQVTVKLDEEIAAAKARKSQAYFKASDEREDLSNRFAQLAKQYGFQECGSP